MHETNTYNTLYQPTDWRTPVSIYENPTGQASTNPTTLNVLMRKALPPGILADTNNCRGPFPTFVLTEMGICRSVRACVPQLTSSTKRIAPTAFNPLSKSFSLPLTCWKVPPWMSLGERSDRKSQRKKKGSHLSAPWSSFMLSKDAGGKKLWQHQTQCPTWRIISWSWSWPCVWFYKRLRCLAMTTDSREIRMCGKWMKNSGRNVIPQIALLGSNHSANVLLASQQRRQRISD